MQQCPEKQDLYQLHIKHLPIAGIHLGTAESLEEIIEVVDLISPKSYSLVKSCVDGVATIKLLAFPVVRRIRLDLLDDSTISRLIDILDEKNIRFKVDKYLSLNKDLTPTKRCKWQEKIFLYYKLKFFLLKLRNRLFY